MKVIQIMPEFGLAGAEIMCENLTRALHDMGHCVIVVSLYNYHSAITDRLEDTGIKVIYLDKKRGLDLSVLKKLTKVLKEEKPDVVHTHLYSIKYAVPAAVFAHCKRRVHTVHNVADKECSRYARKINKLFFHFFSVIPVALSSLIQDTICNEYKLPECRVPIVYNGIDLSRCIEKTEYETEGTLKILHIGRFSDQKNHIGLLNAFETFHNVYPNSELQLIGTGEKESAIRELVHEKELDSSVKFLGQQSNVYPFLHDADIFTLPSLYEGIPMTLIEAMGTGLPIVATDVGGVADMFEHNKSGILTTLDTKDIASAFERLAEKNSFRAMLGQNAKKEAIKFSSMNMAKGYLDIYEIRKA